MEEQCLTLQVLQLIVSFVWNPTDFGAGETHFTAQSRRRGRWIRVESVGTSKRRCRFTPVTRRADEQRQNCREAKVIDHHTVDGAEPATHCPTQRGKKTKTTTSFLSRLMTIVLRTVSLFFWRGSWIAKVFSVSFFFSLSCFWSYFVDGRVFSPRLRYKRHGRPVYEHGCVIRDFFLFSSSVHRESPFENWFRSSVCAFFYFYFTEWRWPNEQLERVLH